VKANKFKRARELRKLSSDKKNIMRHSGYDRKASYVRSKVLRILINLFRFRSRKSEHIEEEEKHLRNLNSKQQTRTIKKQKVSRLKVNEMSYQHGLIAIFFISVAE
jgi:hypothetical protein